MNRITAIWQLFTACLNWFHKTHIAAASSKQSLPPIRYDDDPTDIYLA